MEEKLQKWRAWEQPLHARPPALTLLRFWCMRLLRCDELSDTSVRACLDRSRMLQGARFPTRVRRLRLRPALACRLSLSAAARSYCPTALLLHMTRGT
jgi:hypothetical protein